MRAVCFLPDDAELRQALDGWLAKRPRTLRIEWAQLGGDPRTALAEAVGTAHKKHGFVIVDGPHDVASLQLIDEVCRETFGRRGLPQGVFFAPRKAHDEWRATARPLHAHYHPSRRAISFTKAAPKQLVKSVKTASRTRSIIRWGALGPMAVVFLLAVGGVGFARDGLIRAAAITGLEGAFQARSEIVDLATTFTPALQLENVAVADRLRPMRNVFEFDRFSGGLDVGQLFAGRVHIPELALEGLRFGTERTESGALPPAPGAEPEPIPEPEIDAEQAGPSFEDALDDLIKMLRPPELEELAAVQEARALEQAGRERLAALERKVRGSSLPKRFAEAKAAVATLAQTEPPESFKAVEAAARELAALRPDPSALDGIRKDFDAALPTFDDEQRSIEQARRDLTSAGAAADKAQSLVKRAQEIKKFTFSDALKITALLKDLSETASALGSATTKLNRARNAVLNARSSAERKLKDAEERLQAGRTALADAQGKLDRVGDDLTAKTAALAGSLAQARTDLEAAKLQAEDLLKKLATDLEAARSEATALQADLQAGLDLAASAAKRMADALERDRAELTRRYSMDRFTADEVLRPLLGDSTVDWLRFTLEAYERLKPLLESDGADAEPEKIQRPIGTVYQFPADPETPPRFWAGRVAFTGTLEIQGKPFVLTGTALNLSSNLAASDADAKVEFVAGYDGQKLSATIIVARTGEVTVNLTASGLHLQGKIQNRFLTAGFDQGTFGASVELKVGPTGVKASASITLEGLAITPAPGALDERLRFVGDVLSALNTIQGAVEFQFGGGRFASFAATASAGDEFGAKVRQAIVGQVEEAKNIAFAEIEKRVAGPRKEAEAALADIRAKGGPAVDALLAAVQGDTQALEAQGQAALGRYDEFAKLLGTGGEDPAAAIAALRATLQGLATRSTGLEGAAAKAAAEPLAAAEEALKLADAKKAAVNAVETQVKAEIARLGRLR